jgi:WD40 repeat protein
VQNGTLASGGADNKIIMWNVETGVLLKTLSYHTASVLTLKYLNGVVKLVNGLYLMASGGADMKIVLWDVSAGTVFQVLNGHTASVTALAVWPTGELYSASLDSTMLVWNLTNMQPKAMLNDTASINSFALFNYDCKYSFSYLLHLIEINLNFTRRICIK